MVRSSGVSLNSLPSVVETVVALWNARGSCEQPQNAKTESRLWDENECSPLRQLALHLCQHGLIHAVDEGTHDSKILQEFARNVHVGP